MKLDPVEIMRRFGDAESLRSPFENDWREAARHVLPAEFGRWQTGASSTSVDPTLNQVRRSIFDTTGMRALPKFAAVLERMLTPQGHKWHALRASNDKLMQKRAVKLYFDQLNDLLFMKRYEPRANFQPTQSAGYTSFGAYGNAVKFIGARRDKGGLLYQSVPMQSCYFLQDDEGRVDTLFRRLSLTARQAAQKFGAENLPDKIKQEYDKPVPSEINKFNVIHVVAPRDDYTSDAIDARRYKFMSVYVSEQDKSLIGEPSGYGSFPFAVPQHFRTDNNVYAYSIAQLALGSMNTLNQMKKTVLKQGQKAVDPPVLAHDDGVVNGRMDWRPGAVNYGGVNAQGQVLVHAAPMGNLQVAEQMMQAEQSDINDAFFVTLFEILVEKEDMSATEVMQRAVDKATLLAPTMGLMQCSDLGPTIEREIEVLHGLNMLPDMPPELVEAQGEFTIGYTSPLAKSLHAEETKGFIDLVTFNLQYVAQGGDASVLKRFNMDRANVRMAYERGVPIDFLNSDEEMQQSRDADKQQQQIDNVGKVAPAAAGAAKAIAALPPGMMGGGAPGGPQMPGGPPGAMPMPPGVQ